MALKSTIYKFTISISNLDENYFDTVPVMVAQHPSETTERMMARLLALCLNASESPTFTAGLSTPDEPDIWAKSLDGRLLLWIDVGEPSLDRIKKASRLTKAVKIYSFNNKSDVWWKIEQIKFNALGVDVFQFPWEGVQSLAALVERNMEFSITISEKTLYVSTRTGEAVIPCTALQESDLTNNH